jgi:hypothetical protein
MISLFLPPIQTAPHRTRTHPFKFSPIIYSFSSFSHHEPFETPGQLPLRSAARGDSNPSPPSRLVVPLPAMMKTKTPWPRAGKAHRASAALVSATKTAPVLALKGSSLSWVLSLQLEHDRDVQKIFWLTCLTMLNLKPKVNKHHRIDGRKKITSHVMMIRTWLGKDGILMNSHPNQLQNSFFFKEKSSWIRKRCYPPERTKFTINLAAAIILNHSSYALQFKNWYNNIRTMTAVIWTRLCLKQSQMCNQSLHWGHPNRGATCLAGRTANDKMSKPRVIMASSPLKYRSGL